MRMMILISLILSIMLIKANEPVCDRVVSVHKSATMSSIARARNQGQYYARNGIDGNMGSNGKFFRTNVNPNNWFKVDLKSVYDVTRVIMYARNHGMSRYTRNIIISGSNDSKTFENCGSFKGPAFPRQIVSVPCKGKYRYVKLTQNNGARYSYFSMYEVSIYARYTCTDAAPFNHKQYQSLTLMHLTAGCGVDFLPYFTGAKSSQHTMIFKSFMAIKPFYMNPLVAYWSALSIATVRVQLIKQGKVRAMLAFNGQGTTATNWFSQANLREARPWKLSKLRSGNYNQFSFNANSNRRLSMLRGYGRGCPGYRGIMMVTYGGEKSGGCPWENGKTYPKIMAALKDGDGGYFMDLEFGFLTADSLLITLELAQPISLQTL